MKVMADLDLLATFEAEGYRVSMHLFAPGTVFARHCLCEPRIDAVLYGRLRLVVDGEASLLGPGDWIEVPAGAAVSAEVIGDEPVLGLDATRDRKAS
jgi:quercetin dioxygenase-like cupin family protein